MKLIISPMSTTVEELRALYHMYDREYNPFSPTGLLEHEEKHLIFFLYMNTHTHTHITVHTCTDLQSPGRIYDSRHGCDGDVFRGTWYGVSRVKGKNLYRTGHPRQKATNTNPECHDQTCGKSCYSSLNQREKTSLFMWVDWCMYWMMVGWKEEGNLQCYLHMGKRCRDRTDRAAAHQPSRRYWERP